MLTISALSALFAASLSAELVNAHGVHNHVHRDIAAHKRQAETTSTGAAPTGSSVAATGATSASAAAGTSAATGTTAPAGATSAAAPAGTYVGTGTYNVPPLSLITSGMPTGPVPTVSTTYPAGAVPSFSGAPPLPSPFVFSATEWPALDVIPPTDSDEVKEWMKELDGHDIPNFTPTADGSCVGDPAAAAQAKERNWWTCGGYTSGNDIVACPDKLTWGISFDDGPAPYTPTLLKYLDDHDLSATFFVVGSRVVSYPNILIDEYMAGHEIAVHTWSHHPLTAMTNEQIVAELGWTRKAIQKVLGVTPTTMRAPFGDIDDRVRAISNAMGLRPIIWTTGPGGPFDTNDWRVAGGEHTGEEQFSIFQGILGNASSIDTGFIVLQHDLFEITVDLAVGYTLDAALSHQPPFTLKPIGQCLDIPTNDLYKESATTDITTSKPDVGSNSTSGNSSSGNSSGAAGEGNSAVGLQLPASALVGAVAAALGAVFAGCL